MIPEPVQSVWSWLLLGTFQASIVVLLVVAARKLLAPLLAPRWIYLLWFLVVARLLVPFGPASSLSIFNLTSRLVPERASAETILVIVAEEAPPPPAAAPVAPPAPIEVAGPSVLETAEAGLLLAWLAGALFLVTRKLGAAGLWRLRWRSHPRVDSPKVREALDRSRRALGVRRDLDILATDRVSSPALVGLLRPKLLLPPALVRDLTRSELELVFHHELAHLKRRDILVNILLSAAKTLHWFNPVVRLAVARCRADQELACDDYVLSRVHPLQRTKYGLTILKVLERMTSPRPLPGAVGLLRGTHEIERRIHMIARYRRKPRLASTLGLFAFAALACVALSSATPAEAMSAAAEPEKCEVIVMCDTDACGGEAAAPVAIVTGAGGCESSCCKKHCCKSSCCDPAASHAETKNIVRRMLRVPGPAPTRGLPCAPNVPCAPNGGDAHVHVLELPGGGKMHLETRIEPKGSSGHAEHEVQVFVLGEDGQLHAHGNAQGVLRLHSEDADEHGVLHVLPEPQKLILECLEGADAMHQDLVAPDAPRRFEVRVAPGTKPQIRFFGKPEPSKKGNGHGIVIEGSKAPRGLPGGVWVETPDAPATGPGEVEVLQGDDGSTRIFIKKLLEVPEGSAPKGKFEYRILRPTPKKDAKPGDCCENKPTRNIRVI